MRVLPTQLEASNQWQQCTVKQPVELIGPEGPQLLELFLSLTIRSNVKQALLPTVTPSQIGAQTY